MTEHTELSINVDPYEKFYEPDDDESYECGGEGWVTADCFEDTCCCADPGCDHGVEPCPICNPEGRG